MSTTPEPRSIAFLNLGCPKNTVDSERMMGLLSEAGFALSDVVDGGLEAVIVNTCGFIRQAEEEAGGTLREALAWKKQWPHLRIIVTGCWVARRGRELAGKYPAVEAWFGVYAGEELVRHLQQGAPGSTSGTPPGLTFYPSGPLPASDVPRFRLTPRHYAYLRLADGCSHHCTYCTIPGIRGPFHSRPLRQVAEEARELAGDGAEELILVAQDTTRYGADLDTSLPRLLEELQRIDAVRWIRLMYAHPLNLGRELAGFMTGGKLLRYLDLPIQHAHPEILRWMGRGEQETRLPPLLDWYRERVPGLVLRTTVIVGFPGETAEHFACLADFLGRYRFERQGVFSYSAEDGTPAARFPGRVPPGVVRERERKLLRLQRELAGDFARGRAGREEEVVVDACRPHGKGFLVTGRTYAEAPEIDPPLEFLTGKAVAEGMRLTLPLPQPAKGGSR